MEQQTLKAVSKVVNCLVSSDMKSATKYLSEKHIVRASRVAYKNKIDKRDKSITIMLTLGKPNYQERKFVADCKEAGEPFPVKNVIVKPFPIKRKK